MRSKLIASGLLSALAAAACSSGDDAGRGSNTAGAGGSQTGIAGSDGVTQGSSGGGGDAWSRPQEAELAGLDVVDFPAGVTVASPVATGANRPGPMGPPSGGGSFAASRLRLMQSAGAPPPSAPASAYVAAANKVVAVLGGTTSVAESFDLRAFFRRSGNANCYGPTLAWESHPDALGGDATTGQLPGGDLGIWVASTEGGEACAAAQLNARMLDVQSQVSMGLMVLAGLVQAYESTGAGWPDDVTPGDTLDLTEEMTAAGIEDVTFTAASMSRGDDGDTWTYVVELDYEAPGGGTKHVGTSLQHAVTDRDAGTFEGLLGYTIEDEYTDRNCGERPDGDHTLNGSVHYTKAGPSGLVLQARSATACGLASSSPSANLLDDPVESSALEGAAVNPDGDWADNFSIFTADFEPESSLGSYAYSWQAGAGDSHTRVLQVGLETEAGGEAYFGFGDRVQTSLSGQIQGFICNWAGPGGSHSPADFAKYAQRQALTRDASGRFVAADPSASNITYAPTNSCMYDGTGSFAYDRDLDGDLSDETPDTTAIMQSGTTLGFDLMTIADGEASIAEHIAARGYDLPSYP